MHHMTHIRRDINKKVENSTISQTNERANNLKKSVNSAIHNIESKIKSGEYIIVKNKFGIRI